MKKKRRRDIDRGAAEDSLALHASTPGGIWNNGASGWSILVSAGAGHGVTCSGHFPSCNHGFFAFNRPTAGFLLVLARHMLNSSSRIVIVAGWIINGSACNDFSSGGVNVVARGVDEVSAGNNDSAAGTIDSAIGFDDPGSRIFDSGCRIDNSGSGTIDAARFMYDGAQGMIEGSGRNIEG